MLIFVCVRLKFGLGGYEGRFVWFIGRASSGTLNITTSFGYYEPDISIYDIMKALEHLYEAAEHDPQ